MDYSDRTPDVTMEHDHLGRAVIVSQLATNSTDALNQWGYKYDPETLQLVEEDIRYNLDAANPLRRVLKREYETDATTGVALRPAGYALERPHFLRTFRNAAVKYGYDSAGRLSTVIDMTKYVEGDKFTYNYLADSGSLLEAVAGPAHRVANTYETNRDILDVKSNTALFGKGLVSQFDYTVNSIGQRTDVNRSGSAVTAVNTETWSYNAIRVQLSVTH